MPSTINSTSELSQITLAQKHLEITKALLSEGHKSAETALAIEELERAIAYIRLRLMKLSCIRAEEK
ncbi:hypothetical protein [Persicobacter sp. CCB-QB2]|uniref:hypothetical protein n=1 Tax=Persicobacter sp. CCB-QB2 TaxID=1561025 RepID=UPI0006A959DF|nr:hypothetical protein [Persicobacter sp. CCB-QB2]